jgi:hypothetical protein
MLIAIRGLVIFCILLPFPGGRAAEAPALNLPHGYESMLRELTRPAPSPSGLVMPAFCCGTGYLRLPSGFMTVRKGGRLRLSSCVLRSKRIRSDSRG